MNLRIFSTGCFLLFYFGHFVASEVTLKLWNDGPAILDSNLTFYASLHGDVPEDEYEYEFVDNTAASVTSHAVSSGMTANLTLLVSSKGYQEGYYTMKVSVFRMVLRVVKVLVTKGKVSFELTSSINGKIISTEETPDHFIPVGNANNFTFFLHDPSHFFDGAKMDYIWKFNDSAIFNRPDTVLYNVTAPGRLLVSLSIFALVNTSVIKTGSIDGVYKALVPINNITVQGNVWLKRGEVMTLDITCNGSGLFRHCARVLDKGTDACSGRDPISSTQCSFSTMHYFSKAGKYSVGIMIKNNLNQVNKTVEIQIYDVDKKPQLSTIIFPIASCCIGIVIVVIGTAYHLQQRKTYTIEVADFDFQAPVMLIEKSFVARVKESIRDALDSYKQGQYTQPKMIINGSSRTTPIASHYASIS